VKPRITLITLGVDDLDRAVRFYRDGLGLRTEGIVGREFEHGAVAFFDLQPGLKLALWPRVSLSHDSGLPVGKPSATDVCLAYNVFSRSEVDAVMAEARAAPGIPECFRRSECRPTRCRETSPSSDSSMQAPPTVSAAGR
jgi:catechol 2,3-dioxygenase-like lactoylglutathione lyase family enzyme